MQTCREFALQICGEFALQICRDFARLLQDYKFILKISTCVINAQSMQLLSRIFQDISRAIESRYLIVTAL